MTLTQNHFELFGFPVDFDIDQQQLSERYRELQRNLHPDRYANAPDQERRLAVQRAAQVNEAFQTLKSPLQRARYLLQLKGFDIDAEKETHQDAEFLMQQIELREALAEVQTAADPLDALSGIMQSIRESQAGLIAELQKRFAAKDEVDHLETRQVVQKMQFFSRLQQQAEEIEEQLVDAL